jgi:hypothetical protein
MLDRILQIVQKLQTEEEKEMFDLTELKNTVAAIKSTEESAKVVIQSAIDLLNDILGKLANTVDPAEIAAIVADGQAATAALTADKDDLAKKVAEFTPPPPPPAP